MCVVIEGKKPRLVKHANPIMIVIKEALTRKVLEAAICGIFTD